MSTAAKLEDLLIRFEDLLDRMEERLAGTTSKEEAQKIDDFIRRWKADKWGQHVEPAD